MNQLLAIETSSEICSVALSIDGATQLRQQHAPLRHADLLLPAVRSLLDEAGTSLSRLDGIVFGRGPGSFTSLRIGIGVVQGLAWGADVPVVPISSLACVAYPLADETSGNILVAMDARMSEVYHCHFANNESGVLKALETETVSPPDHLTTASPQSTRGAGNGFERYPQLASLGESLLDVRPDILPSALALLPLASQWLAESDPLPAAMAQPVYIRDQVAVKPG